MARARRRQTTSVIERLFDDPRRFDFFQAVRVLERQAAIDNRRRRYRLRRPVGHDFAPGNEPVRFHAETHLVYPGNALSQAEPGDSRQPATLTAAFIGLIGPLGVLPQHYSELVVNQNRQRSTALGQFLDLIHHRAISLFYRAWLKYRLPMVHEQAENRLDIADHDHAQRFEGKAIPPADDPGVNILAALTGLGTPGLRNRQHFADQQVWHYAGLLSATQRSVTGLESLLADVLGHVVRVESFVGSWIAIDADSQTRLPSPQQPEGQFCRLGVDSMAGARAWDAQGRFRLQIGPLDGADFRDFMPDGPALQRLTHLVRLYVGPEYDIDIQVTLAAPAVPALRLPIGGENAAAAPRLGWNTWMLAAPSPVDRTDASFPLSGIGNEK